MDAAVLRLSVIAGLVEAIEVSTLQFWFHIELEFGARTDSHTPCNDSTAPQGSKANCFANCCNPYVICTAPY